MATVLSRSADALGWLFEWPSWPCTVGFLSRREGLIVRGWSSVLFAWCEPGAADELSEMGESGGMGRVVTIWVTALEKNFYSCYRKNVSIFPSTDGSSNAIPSRTSRVTLVEM